MITSYADKPLILAFHAVNCGPCKLQKKELATLRNMGLGFQMVAIDTNKWPHIGSRFNVGKLPCTVIVKNGEMQLKMEGLISANVLAEQIRSYIQNKP